MLTFTLTVDRYNTDRSLYDEWIIFLNAQVNPTTVLWIRCSTKPGFFYISMTSNDKYWGRRNLDHLLDHIQYRSKTPWT